MKDDFYDFVAVELQKSLPDSWQKVQEEKPNGYELCGNRPAFLALRDSKARQVNLFVWPLSLELNAGLEKKLLILRDDIIAEGTLFIVINEEIEEMRLGNTGVFISEKLLIHCPNFIWVTCCREKKYKITFDGIHFENLHVGLSNIWNAKVTYVGPKIGSQPVNLEIMSDTCWKCQRKIKTVTGIVFPNRQLKNWNNPTWQYYHSLISLDHVKGKSADLIEKFVVTLRQDDANITTVGYKFSNTVRRSYFAAACPYCDALCGSFYVIDSRMDYLHSLQSRMDGSLNYYSITLDVDRYLIQSLFVSSEGCDHTTDAGWGRHK
ncbi:MAG: hypothetical protein ABIX36_11035 [Mucilaginibacter sp.]|uniref:hypothetical protein n=2 Tax=unclassified Mucilaginibacter TaxID=2617802 RepID=UPI0032663418